MSDKNTSGDGTGDETVTLTKAEHDALQARIRLADKTEKDAKAKAAKAKAEAERDEANRRLKAAQDAGIGKELREAETERDDALAKLNVVLTENAIRDAAGDRKWSKSAQRTAVKMVDSGKLERDDEGIPTADSLKDVLDGLEKEYPDIYFAGGPTTAAGDDKGGKRKAATTPSTPASLAEHGKANLDGLLTPEEFMATPFAERQTPEFRKRLEKAMPSWPETFNHNEL